MEEQIDLILKINSEKEIKQKVNSDTESKHLNGFSNKTATNGKLNKTEWVRLNIGGKYFVTTKTTLCKNAHSFFYKLCQDDPTIGLTTDKVV